MLVQHIYSLCAGKWPCLFVWHWSGSFHYVRMRVSHPFLLARKEWEWRIYKETELCCSTASATRPAANIYISDMSSSTPKEVHLLLLRGFYHQLILTCVYRCKLLFITSFFFNSQILPPFSWYLSAAVTFSSLNLRFYLDIIFRLTGFPFLSHQTSIYSRENQLYLFPFTKHGRALESRPGNQYGTQSTTILKLLGYLSLSLYPHRYIEL